MGLRINQNTTAMSAHLQLQKTDSKLSKSIERLSSGKRINSAADDPAGMAISQNLSSQVEGIGVAISNSSDASNLIKTAEGALDEVDSLLRTMRNLALNAANTGVQDTTAIAADQTQVTSNLAALNRIASNTQFGTKNLLDGTATGLTFQIGANAGQTSSVSISSVKTADLGISTIDVSSGASAAITALDAAISSISTLRAQLGAAQQDLESNVNSLGVAKENISSSLSSIEDTDMASEMVNFTKFNIMEQAGVSMLSQANNTPQNLLKLLNG